MQVDIATPPTTMRSAARSRARIRDRSLRREAGPPAAMCRGEPASSSEGANGNPSAVPYLGFWPLLAPVLLFEPAVSELLSEMPRPVPVPPAPGVLRSKLEPLRPDESERVR